MRSPPFLPAWVLLTVLSGAAQAAQQQIEPLILLDQQSRVAACGARVTVSDDNDGMAELTWRVARDAGGPKTVLSAGHTRAGLASGISAISLHVGDVDVAGLLLRAPSSDAGRLQVEGRLSAERQGALFRDFMLGGGRLDMQLDDGTALRFDVRGPAPRDVFRSYLQCSGDLYRSDRMKRGD